MKLTIGKKIIGNYSWKRVLYTLCFLMFCIIDQRTKTGSGLDGIIESFRDATGLVMAGIVISHYKVEDFIKRKMPYIIWTVVSIIGGPVIFFLGMDERPFLNDWIMIILNIIIWGYIVIHTFIHIVVEKNFPKLNKSFLIVWVIMMLLMIVSRSHYIWPLCYMIMFGCFYMTDFTKEEQNDLWQGAVDGIILSFILFQGFCCVFRPYDAVRYVGIHNNCNLNALYYLAVLAAVFTRSIYLTKKGTEKADGRDNSKWNKWQSAFYWLAAGAALSYIFMTIGRIAWITAFIMSLLCLVILNGVLQRKRLIRNGMRLVLCTLLMFPVCFSATRYFPPVFHHPIWFWGEWSDDKVHSWDPWNSEKYVDMDEFLEAALGRITESVENLLEHSPFAMKAEAAEAVPEEDPRIEAAVLRSDQGNDGFLIRSTIYKYYITHLNWRGHPYEEQGFQITRFYWIGHAHNIFLQYGTDFGIPVMILLAVLAMWGIIVSWKCSWKNHSLQDIAAMFFILIPVLFGLFEYSWGVGSLSITMLFLAWGQVMREKKE